MNLSDWRKLVGWRHAADAKSHGRPVGKPLRHPILGERPRERVAGNRLCEQFRKEWLMLSGPRRAQAGSHLPTASARDQRSDSDIGHAACGGAGRTN